MSYFAGTDDPCDALGSPAPCFLCAAPARICAMFIPREPWLYCAIAPIPGRIRFFWYTLCASHQPPTQEIAQRVEAELARRSGGRR